jgi:mRNA interferase HicA
MTGKEFIKRAKRHARRIGKTYRFDPRHGKGSHGMLYVGDRRTTVKQGELAAGTFRNMLQQLDIAKEEF